MFITCRKYLLHSESESESESDSDADADSESESESETSSSAQRVESHRICLKTKYEKLFKNNPRSFFCNSLEGGGKRDLLLLYGPPKVHQNGKIEH